MKRTIRLFCTLLAVLFCLTACSDQEAPTTTNTTPAEKPTELITLTADTFSAMHLWASDTGIYNNQRVIIRQYSTDSFTDSKAERKKTFSLKGNDTVVNYKESFRGAYGDSFSQYQSADKRVTIDYFNKTNQIDQIVSSKNYFSLPTNLITEEDYLTWIKELLKQYGVTNLSEYEYSCKTSFKVSGDNYYYTETKNCFCLEKDLVDSELKKYSFRYDKKINGYYTSDYILISISFTNDMILIRFDQGQFSDVSKIELDETKLQTTLVQYVNNFVNTQKYELLSYTVKDQTLTYVDEKLCLVCSVELNLNPLDNPEIESFTVLESIGVFCE